MKLERKLVQTLLDMANDGGVCPAPGPIMAELCRAWLALDAAPEAELVSAEDEGWWINGARDADEEMEIDRMTGEKVRLVATPATGGPGGG